MNRQIGLIVLDLDGFRAAQHAQRPSRWRQAVARRRDAMSEARRGRVRRPNGKREFSVLTAMPIAKPRGARRRVPRRGAGSIDRSRVKASTSMQASGCAEGGEDDASFASLVRNADRSLYLVKAEHERAVAPPLSIDDDAPERLDSDREVFQRAATRGDRLAWRNRPRKSSSPRSPGAQHDRSRVSLAMPDAVTRSTEAIACWSVRNFMSVTRYCMKRPGASRSSCSTS